jgi:hypothetical protein
MIRSFVRSNVRKLLIKKSLSMMYEVPKKEINQMLFTLYYYLPWLMIGNICKHYWQCRLHWGKSSFPSFALNVSFGKVMSGSPVWNMIYFLVRNVVNSVTCSPEVCGAGNEEGGTSALRLCSSTTLIPFPYINLICAAEVAFWATQQRLSITLRLK